MCVCVCVCVYFWVLRKMSFRGRGRGRGGRFGGPPGILPRDEDGNVVIPKKQEGPPPLYPVCVCVFISIFLKVISAADQFLEFALCNMFLLLRN